MSIGSTYNRNPPSIYRGVVEDNKDPQSLGRCKIRVPAIYGELSYPIDILPWARPIVLSPVGSGRGVVSIPEIGDIVWVMFEGANRDYPLYIGGTYALGDLDISNDKVDIHIDSNNLISYDKVSKSYTIRSNENTLNISPEGISIVGDTQISGNLNIVGDLFVTGIARATDLFLPIEWDEESDES